MMVLRQWHCCIVEWVFLKPNWWDRIQSWDLVSWSILCSRIFSNIFDMIDNRLIGLYEVNSVGCFPGYSIMITLACLSVVGQYSSLSIALYSCRRVCCPLGGSSWIIWAVIWSGPGVLDGHTFWWLGLTLKHCTPESLYFSCCGWRVCFPLLGRGY